MKKQLIIYFILIVISLMTFGVIKYYKHLQIKKSKDWTKIMAEEATEMLIIWKQIEELLEKENK